MLPFYSGENVPGARALPGTQPPDLSADIKGRSGSLIIFQLQAIALKFRHPCIYDCDFLAVPVWFNCPSLPPEPGTCVRRLGRSSLRAHFSRRHCKRDSYWPSDSEGPRAFTPRTSANDTASASVPREELGSLAFPYWVCLPMRRVAREPRDLTPLGASCLPGPNARLTYIKQ